MRELFLQLYMYVSIDYLFLFNLCMELFIIVRISIALKTGKASPALPLLSFCFRKVVIVRVSKVTYNYLQLI